MSIHIDHNRVVATSVEGVRREMSIKSFADKLNPKYLTTGDLILPDGVKAVVSNPSGDQMTWVYQASPRIYSLKWIANNSEHAYGYGAKYRIVRVALPYLILLVRFYKNNNQWSLNFGLNECFFSKSPLSSMDDSLNFPALLNCSSQPLDRTGNRHNSLICLNYCPKKELEAANFEPNQDLRLRKLFSYVLKHLIEGGFNKTGEGPSGSWFTKSSIKIPQIGTIEEWERNSLKDPLFALDLPWIDTQFTLKRALPLFKDVYDDDPVILNQDSLERALFND